MAEVITILSLGWLANLCVHFWISLMSKTKNWITAKPFSCQECMGFWIGLLYAYFTDINHFIIFACLTSLSAVSINNILSRISR